MDEPREIRLKRLGMRSMRRGIKEMDLILSAYRDRHMSDLSDADLNLYENLLSENDHDIYAWVLGTQQTPPEYTEMMAQVTAMAEGIVKPGS